MPDTDTKWTPVGEGHPLPPLNKVVLLRFGNGYRFGGRVPGDEGWLWGVAQCGWEVYPAKTAEENDIEADEDYQPSAWHPAPELPS